MLLLDKADELVTVEVYPLLTLHLGQVKHHNVVASRTEIVVSTHGVICDVVLPYALLREVNESPLIWILIWVLIDTTREEVELEILVPWLSEYHNSRKPSSIFGKA